MSILSHVEGAKKAFLTGRLDNGDLDNAKC